MLTVFIPMRNEEEYIEACLHSVMQNLLPPEAEMEVLVFDGESTDRSVDIVKALAATDPRIRLINNPRRIQSAAFNRALEQARGEYFFRLDAHSLYRPDYFATCLRLLQETGADNVGGVMAAEGRTSTGRAVAAAVSSRFGVGDAQYRVATRPGWVDTVYLGAWRTATLRNLGGMREDLAVNEDYELNSRLRKAGGRIWLDPSLRTHYFPRDSFVALARQYTRYGFWKARTILEHPWTLRWRQLAAPALVIGILFTPLAIAIFGPIGWLALGIYAAANLSASIIAARQGWATLPLLPFIFLTIHCTWGAGFLVGLGYWSRHRPGLE